MNDEMVDERTWFPNPIRPLETLFPEHTAKVRQFIRTERREG